MSWDVMVFNYHGSPPKDFDDLPDDHKPDPLGPADEVRASVSKYLPGVDWSDPTWGDFVGEGFSIEFNVGNDDPITDMMLHVRGGGDAISAILQFAKPNKWSLLDSSTGDFIDPDNPSQEGWEGFQAFRDKMLDTLEEDGK